MGHAVTEGDQVRRRRLQRYLNEGLGRVEGWLDPRSAKVIAALGEYQTAQGIRGAVGEIGVHHGKLLVLLDRSCSLDHADRLHRQRPEPYARNMKLAQRTSPFGPAARKKAAPGPRRATLTMAPRSSQNAR